MITTRRKMIIRDVKVPIFPDIPRAVIPAKAGIPYG